MHQSVGALHEKDKLRTEKGNDAPRLSHPKLREEANKRSPAEFRVERKQGISAGHSCCKRGERVSVIGRTVKQERFIIIRLAPNCRPPERSDK